jgi:aspartate kinase
MIVMKFGGTSVESAEAIRRVAEIVHSRLHQRPVVVVSAMGKTTNKLLAMAASAASGRVDAATALLEELRAMHVRESAGLGFAEAVDSLFDQLVDLLKGLTILGELTPRAADAVSAYGERLSSLIVTALFNQAEIKAAHIDARNVIVTDRRHGHAAPLFAETNARLMAALPQLAQTHVPVMGGFIASNEDGVTTTLGRGGSDYTASIVGAGIGAEEIQIWTDVDGMLTADPTIFPGSYRVETCSFAEAAELAYFGAKVLHPATVLPAIEKNIPVRILNSRRPEVEGTLIVSDPPPSSRPIRSIACKRNITLVNIVSSRMLMAHGFLRRIFEIFDRHETPVDMLATSEVSVSLTVDNTRALDAIRAEIGEFAEITMEDNHAIVCLVGENIRNCPEVPARTFAALCSLNTPLLRTPIKTRMVSQGASQLNISLVVAAADLAGAVESLHREFFS